MSAYNHKLILKFKPLLFVFPIVTYYQEFYILLQDLMRHSASRKKNRERSEQIGSGNVGVDFEEEDLVTNVDEESEDEGKKKTLAVYITDDQIKWLLIDAQISNYIVSSFMITNYSLSPF